MVKLYKWADIKDQSAGFKPKQNTCFDELIISLDCEFDGYCPGQHNLLQFSMCVVDANDGTFVDKFSFAVERLPDREPEAKCMTDFWFKHQDKLEDLIKTAVHPYLVMESFRNKRQYWNKISRRQTYVCRPSSVDWNWIVHYHGLYNHSPTDVLPYFSTCIRSYLHGVSDALNIPWYELNKLVSTDSIKRMNAHDAYDDAKAHLIQYLNLRIVATFNDPIQVLKRQLE